MENKGMHRHYFEQLRGRWGLFLLLAIGLLLLLFGGGGGGEKKAADDNYFQEAEAYRAMLEARLTTLCTSVGGVSHVEVLLTLEAGNVNVYAADGGEDYVVSGGDGMLLCRRMPPVSGVAVVCRAEDAVSARSELTTLIAAALHIGTNRVHVSFR